MKFPNKFEFLEKFGLEPVDEDISSAYFRYVKKTIDDGVEIDISFSGIAESLQVILRINGRDLMVVSSEKTNSIEIFDDQTGAGVHAKFDLIGAQAEAKITFEPQLNCSWWTLRSV